MKNHPALALLLLSGLATPALSDTVTGQVVNHLGVGVAGVNIGAEDLIGGGDGNLANGGTNSGGFFTITIDPGLYQLTFEPPAPPAQPLVTAVVTDVFVAGALDLGIVQLAQGAVLSGRLLTPSSTPAVNVNLDVVDLSTNQNLTIQNDATDALGVFSVVTPLGSLELRFKPSQTASPLLAPLAVRLQLEGSTDLGDLSLLPGFLVTAVALDASFSAVRDADVDVHDVVTRAKLYTPGDNTDNSGFVDFVVPAGVYDLEFCPDFADLLVVELVQGVAVSATTNLGIVSMQAGVVLSGHVRNQVGTDVFNADVDLFDHATQVEVPLCGDNTDTLGNYAVVVPTGQFDVVFTPSYDDKLSSRTYANVAVAGNTARNGVLLPCDCGESSGIGRAGSGGIVPEIAASGRSLRLGNPDWSFDVSAGLGGASGVVLLGLGGQCGSGAGAGLFLPQVRLSAPMPFTLDGSPGLPGAGGASFHFELPSALGLVGTTLTARALIFDAGAPSGFARTPKLCGQLCD